MSNFLSLISDAGRLGVGLRRPDTGVHISKNIDDAFRITRVGINGELPGVDPYFDMGYVRLAGVDLPELQWRYGDTGIPSGRKVAGLESSGTYATVSNNARGSAFENFIVDQAAYPWFRLNSSGSYLQIGPGSTLVPAGSVSRTANVVTVDCGVNWHDFRDNSTLAMYPGEANFPQSPFPGSLVINWVSQTEFTYNEVGPDAVSTVDLVYSAGPDTSFGRVEGSDEARTVIDALDGHTVRIGGSDHQYFDPGLIIFPNASFSIYGTGYFYLGSDFAAIISLSQSDGLLVDPNWLFNNQGYYKSAVWFNGGGQTQTNQEVFVVGTGAGSVSTDLSTASDGRRAFVKNEGQGGVNTLTVNPAVGDTINDGASDYTLQANEAVLLVAVGGDWKVFKFEAA